MVDGVRDALGLEADRAVLVLLHAALEGRIFRVDHVRRVDLHAGLVGPERDLAAGLRIGDGAARSELSVVGGEDEVIVVSAEFLPAYFDA